ncbi:MAG: hypothetical protein ACOC1U_04275 [Spirochaetota bacterium]
MKIFGLFCVVIVTVSCAPLPPIPFVTDADFTPPVILNMLLPSDRELEMHFDEPVRLVGEVIASGGVHVVSAEADDRASGGHLGAPSRASASRGAAERAPANDVNNHQTETGGARGRVRFRFAAPPEPMTEHHVEAQVSDTSGNHLRFLAHFYGHNPMVPAMLINEFTTQGSGGHPDIVELRVLSDGNLAGVTLYEGVPENWEQRLVFPALDVTAGDYIVVHFKPEDIPEEHDELVSPDTSGGLDAHPDAWDFWVPEGSGLSGNNGVIALCENPLGGYIDAVLYSNRTSASDEHYRGFGSRKVMERADALFAAGAWRATGPLVAPEDAVNPEPSTATRSMARASSPEDTNTAADWHITPTRGLSAGFENTDEVYEP